MNDLWKPLLPPQPQPTSPVETPPAPPAPPASPADDAPLAPPAPPVPPPARKPRPEAKLKRLSDHLQEQIYDFSRTATLLQTVNFIASLGTQTSVAATSRFLAWYRLKQSLDRHQAALDSMLETLARRDPDITPEQIYDLSHMFFSSIALQNQDCRAWHLVQGIAVRRARLELDRQIFEATKPAPIDPRTDEERALTPETLAKIERELHLFPELT